MTQFPVVRSGSRRMWVSPFVTMVISARRSMFVLRVVFPRRRVRRMIGRIPRVCARGRRSRRGGRRVMVTVRTIRVTLCRTRRNRRLSVVRRSSPMVVQFFARHRRISLICRLIKSRRRSTSRRLVSVHPLTIDRKMRRLFPCRVPLAHRRRIVLACRLVVPLFVTRCRVEYRLNKRSSFRWKDSLGRGRRTHRTNV